nr:probable inactive purple acid phosphatase 27 [Solanum lycopersicum]
MTVTWTSGYNIDEVVPFHRTGSPARAMGWSDPGFIHTSFLKELWPNVQKRDCSNEYNDYQPGSLMTTDTLIDDLGNIDAVFLIGHLPYANYGYTSRWDQFTAQVEPINSISYLQDTISVLLTLYNLFSGGNHERTWENSGSIYNGLASVTEHDWREGSERYKLIEQCFASANKHKQSWLIFAAHHVLGYSSNEWYVDEGLFEEAMGREHLQKLWQNYKVDMTFFGHVHNYERVCPIYQNKEKGHTVGTSYGFILSKSEEKFANYTIFLIALPESIVYIRKSFSPLGVEEECRKALYHMVIIDELPFRFVEKEVDNAGSNTLAITELSKQLTKWGTNLMGGSHLLIRRMAHIVNLIAQYGTK